MRLRRFFPKLAASMSVSLVLLGVGAAQTPVAHEFNPPTVPAFTSLVSFNQTNGAYPGGSTLVQGTDGNFYGVTDRGGINGDGTVYKITSAGLLTTVHSLHTVVDGTYPVGTLIQSNG